MHIQSIIKLTNSIEQTLFYWFQAETLYLVLVFYRDGSYLWVKRDKQIRICINSNSKYFKIQKKFHKKVKKYFMEKYFSQISFKDDYVKCIIQKS